MPTLFEIERPLSPVDIGVDRSQPVLLGSSWADDAWQRYEDMGVEIQERPYIITEEGLSKRDGSPISRDVEREKYEAAWYLSSNSRAYLERITKLAEGLPVMDDTCRIAVIIPAHTEEKDIYNTLVQWGGSTDLYGKPLDESLYEIDVIVNGPQGYAHDATVAEIERFKASHPRVRVNYLDVEFSTESGNTGMARKIISDIVMLRSLTRVGQKAPLYIETSDADMVYVNPKTLAERIQTMDNKPYLDAIVSTVDFDPLVLAHNDLIFFTIRARQIARKLIRARYLRPEFNEHYSVYNAVSTPGTGCCLSVEALALIGGYLPMWEMEDYNIGDRIRLLRGNHGFLHIPVPVTFTIEPSSTRLQSSPRRFIYAAAQETLPYAKFTDSAFTQGVRNTSPTAEISQLPGARISEENVGRFEEVLEQVFAWQRKFIFDSTVLSKQRLLLAGFLGLSRDDYSIDDNGRVAIHNIENLRQAFEGYRKKRLLKHIGEYAVA